MAQDPASLEVQNRECYKQFSVKVGTIFEDSAIPLDKWLVSIWLIANARTGSAAMPSPARWASLRSRHGSCSTASGTQ